MFIITLLHWYSKRCSIPPHVRFINF